MNGKLSILSHYLLLLSHLASCAAVTYLLGRNRDVPGPMSVCGQGGLLWAKKAGREALDAASSASFLLSFTKTCITGTTASMQEPTENAFWQPVAGVKSFFVSQRLFEEQREHKALNAARERVNSDDEKEVECRMDEGPEGSTSGTTSAWDEPPLPLSSLLPSPSPSSMPLPSELTTGQSTAASMEDDNERESQIRELQKRWGEHPDARHCAKRLLRRQRKAQDAPPHEHATKGVSKWRRREAKPMKTELVTQDLPVVSTSWKLVDDHGFKIVKWDGCASTPITDTAGTVVAVLLGQPRGLRWGEAVEDATATIKNTVAQPCVSELAGEHRCSPFPAAAIGISYGGGQKSTNILVNSQNLVQFGLRKRGST
ncbi:hypothetical protein BDN71DRAFT_1434401 [Pleurotus eryngii]|uniref:Uncharacterized protein n=1 Tax=Pleurotus eryngii TaxID=5323 RepID=A0A9P5ZS63_PLEER|nr:hypothetical protein BDN71DRAFT_1434401 [Pleurotus eryngii]